MVAPSLENQIFGLETTFKGHLVQLLCSEQGHLQLDHVYSLPIAQTGSFKKHSSFSDFQHIKDKKVFFPKSHPLNVSQKLCDHTQYNYHIFQHFSKLKAMNTTTYTKIRVFFFCNSILMIFSPFIFSLAPLLGLLSANEIPHSRGAAEPPPEWLFLLGLLHRGQCFTAS